MSWWIHDMYQNGEVILLISWIFWVIFSITLHELGHGWAALREGDTTPRDLGHMTGNPIVHMGIPSLVIFALFGLAWGLMPVNPSRFRHRKWGDAIVSFAGPAVNLIITIVCMVLLIAWLAIAPQNLDLYPKVATFLWAGSFLNISLFILNLIPFPPLDGSRILASFVPAYERLLQSPNLPLYGLAFIAVIFLTPVGTFIFVPGYIITLLVVDGFGYILDSPGLFETMNSV